MYANNRRLKEENKRVLSVHAYAQRQIQISTFSSEVWKTKDFLGFGVRGFFVCLSACAYVVYEMQRRINTNSAKVERNKG